MRNLWTLKKSLILDTEKSIEYHEKLWDTKQDGF